MLPLALLVLIAATIGADAAGILTALAGLIGALIAAYRILRPAAPEPEPVPEHRPEDQHRYDHVSDEHHPGDVQVITELRSALAESRKTVHALRRRLDAATGVHSEDPEPPKDWLSR